MMLAADSANPAVGGLRPGTLAPAATGWRRLLSALPWRRRVYTPHFLQSHAAECGASCLGIVLAYFGRWVSLAELRTACVVTRDGCTAADITRAARRYGMRVGGWRREPEQLRRMQMPVVLFWEFGHFLVLEGFSRTGYYLNDPETGRRHVDAETFDAKFTGVALAMVPGPDFSPGGTKPAVMKPLWHWVRDHRTLLAVATVAGLLLTLPTLALAVLLGAFTDRVVATGEPLGSVLVLAVAGLAALCFATTWFQKRCLRMVSVRVAVAKSSELIERLLRIPLDFIVHRHAGDIVSRMKSVDRVATSVSGRFAGMAIELAMSILMLAFMVYYDAVLAAMVTALAVSGGVALRLMTRLRVLEAHKLRRAQAQLSGIGMVGLATMESLRATGGETHLFSRFAAHLARELRTRQKFAEIGAVTVALGPMVMMLGAALVLGVGGLRVVAGTVTVGELMSLYLVATNFLRPVTQLFQVSDLLQMLDADLRRIHDVEEAGRDPLFAVPDATASGDTASGQVETFAGRLRLTGRIDVKGVSFAYGTTKRDTLHEVDLNAAPGRWVAVVGPSGAGKSTLARLLMGMGSPREGEILFDGRRREHIPRDVFTDSVAYVDQNVALFAGSIEENLTMWDATVPERLVVQAARDAAIHDEIITRPMGYKALVEEAGRNFSGGQRQRLEIARALVSNPSLLILDEATSALDAVVEERILDAVRRRGCACILFAHRLSSIRNCDEIVVLSSGRIRQRGRHEALLADEDDLYRQLVHVE